MSEGDDSLPPIDPVKKQMFLTIVQAAIVSAAAGEPVLASHAMGRAFEACELIPEDLSAAQAANVFVMFAFDPPPGEFAPGWTSIETATGFDVSKSG